MYLNTTKFNRTTI